MVSQEQYDRLLEELQSLQGLLAVQDERIRWQDEVIATFEDKDFFDVVAQATIDTLREQRDKARGELAAIAAYLLEKGWLRVTVYGSVKALIQRAEEVA